MRTPAGILMLSLLAPAVATAVAPDDLALVEFASGFSSPVAIRHAGDGSGRLYVVERSGRVVAISAAGATLGTVLDFTANPPPQGFTFGTGGDERGLLGLAFHPDFPTDPRMFVYYIDGSNDTVVASYAVSGDPLVANPASASIVLRVDQDFPNHNGGDIHFGADDYLYIGLGDGGGANDDCNRAQTLDPANLMTGGGCAPDAGYPGQPVRSLALLGKMLRIDVDGSTAAPVVAGQTGICGGNADGSANYAIPAGNPFADGSTANGCDEVWHYGLRNPYRFSFDRATGDMFIGDVGQGTWEEVSYATVLTGGVDFGWKPCEGAFQRGETTLACNDGSTLPILQYPNQNTDNQAVTGGFRYRGPIVPLQGDYVYADYGSGRIWIATQSGASWNAALWQDTGLNPSSFGEDEAGNLYLTNIFGGQVYRFTSAQVSNDLIFADGFED